MASRIFRQFPGSLEYGLVVYDGTINIASNATVSSDTIPGATVARTGAGTYVITFTDTFQSLLACTLTVEAATTVDLVPQVKSADLSGAGTITFVLHTAGTATDPSAACKVHCRVAVKNSTVTSP